MLRILLPTLLLLCSCNDFENATGGHGPNPYADVPIMEFSVFSCPPGPFHNCNDFKNDEENCNAWCEVKGIFEDEGEKWILACTEGYEGGHPDEVDENLPVEVCWHLVYEPLCEANSEGTRLELSFRSEEVAEKIAEVKASCRTEEVE
ncbi:hypothetical protein KKF34_08070 [Myxococcota bacterium]|nr:hypothetical protein [Myxococcota bacterium]MBU1380482.1 hypothetical protein [Myxococcota bacterium]MBU1496817.1 hypothetical protein [Myxococcota bacterium]